MSRLSGLVLVLALTGCGESALAPRLVDGEPAARDPSHEPLASSSAARPVGGRSLASRRGSADAALRVGAVSAQIVDARTGAPLAGHDVAIEVDGELSEWAVTDEDGWIVGEEDVPDGLVRLGVDRGDWLDEVTLSHVHVAGTSARYAVDSGVLLLSPVRARLVDPQSGAPLAMVEVAIEIDETIAEWCVTDEDGWTIAVEELPHGPVTLCVQRGPLLDEVCLTHAHEPCTEPVTGHEYPVDLGTEVVVEVRAREPRTPFTFDVDLLGDPEDSGSLLASGELHVGSPLRVDLSAGPLWLHLTDEEGWWEGLAPVVPGDPTRALVELEPRGHLAGRVAGADGRGFEHAWVTLWQGEDFVDGEHSDRRGRWVMRGLRPGAYELSVSDPRHATVELPVRVTGGVRTDVDVVSAPLVVAGSVEGVLTSETGSFHDDARVLLWTDGGVLRQEARWVETDGRQVAPFAFEDVPAGTHRLEVSDDSGFDWTPRSREVRPPAQGIELRCDDRPARAVLSIAALDAATGEPLPTFDLALLDPRGPAPSNWGSGPLTLTWRIDGPVLWVVYAEGRRPETGRLEDLAPKGRRDGLPVLHADVHLQPGHRVLLAVQAEEDERALAGVAVVLDGREIGVTGADGLLVHDGPWPPATWELSHPEWECAQISWADGDDHWHPLEWVLMRPR